MTAAPKPMPGQERPGAHAHNGRRAKAGLDRVAPDAAPGELRRQLTYELAWSGGTLVVADRYFPSPKTCSSCGGVKAEGSPRDAHLPLRLWSRRRRDLSLLLPGVHRIASLTKRWLLSTHQGRFEEAHLRGYLDVLLPLQPTDTTQPRARRLPAARARGWPQSGEAPGPRHGQAPTGCPAQAADDPGPPAQPRPPACEPSLATRRPSSWRVRWNRVLHLNGPTIR